MRRATFVLAALLMTTACGSMGDGGLGSIGDIILGSPSSTQSSDVKGTVAAIDTNARRIDLNVTYVNNLRDNNNGQRGSIYYDNNTTVTYNNTNYSVTDLERGDEIEVRGVADNGRYIASQIIVVRDAT
ncbi:MAG TPA: hypothetical protein VFV49_08260 [Thermoanaerobaculia bacterium]|nr:hypothetical protein [Thermoanaerobaculia bacterium]